MLSRGGVSARQWAVSMMVIAGHLGAWLLLTHSRWTRERPPSDTPLQVVLIRQPEKSQPLPVETRRPALRSVQPVPAIPAVLAPPATSDAPVGAITDWNATARDAAEDALKRDRKKAGQHPFEHLFPTTPAPQAPGLFGSQQENHRSGRVEDGQRFWVSDNCYFDVPRGPPPPPLVGEVQQPVLPQCKPPPTGGGERMFDSLTPDYLKKPPPGKP